MSKTPKKHRYCHRLFYQYANQDGECDMLNKAELKELLENEFGQILKVRIPCRDLNTAAILLSPPSYPFVIDVRLIEDFSYFADNGV